MSADVKTGKCLILCGHPIAGSFNSALAERYRAEMAVRGLEVRVMELHAMDFDPALQTRKPGDAELAGAVALFWENLQWADHFVLVHPLWWGGMPAKLKALFDIGLQHGKAYQYVAGKMVPDGLLKGRSARVIVTSDTPGWVMALLYRNAHFGQLKRQILSFCGMAPVRFLHLSPLRTSDAGAREKMLVRVAGVAAKDGAALA